MRFTPQLSRQGSRLKPNLALVPVVMACAALLSTSAVAQDALTPPEQAQAERRAQWDFVSMEIKTWGEPISSWRLTSQGGGSWTETRKGEYDPLGTYTLVWHEIPDDGARYRKLEAILARLPVTAPDSSACTNMMTDLAYGTIRMTRGATTTEIAWNSGCMDDGYRSFMAILKEADLLVAEAGRAGKVLREERFPAP